MIIEGAKFGCLANITHVSSVDSTDGTSSIEVTGSRRFRITDAHTTTDDLDFGLGRARVTVLDDSIHELAPGSPEYEEAEALQALLVEKMAQVRQLNVNTRMETDGAWAKTHRSHLAATASTDFHVETDF